MKLLRMTPARLNTYLECPRRYHLRYVAKAQADPTPRAHLALGSSVHTALARWWDCEPALRRWASSADVDRLLAGCWSTSGYRDAEHARTWFGRASAWLYRYVLERMPAEQPRGVERTVAFVRGDVAYEGRADRIDHDRHGLVVVDYKLGREAPTEADAAGSLALAVYAYGAWRTLHEPCTRVELHHVPTGTVATAHRDVDWLRRLVGRADEVAAEVQARQDSAAGGGPVDELFPPVVGPLCGSCEFRAYCPEGQARPADEPWAALDRGEGA